MQNFSTWHPVFLHVRGFALSVYVKEDHIVVVTCQGNHPSRIHVIVYVRAQSHKICNPFTYVRFSGKVGFGLENLQIVSA